MRPLFATMLAAALPACAGSTEQPLGTSATATSGTGAGGGCTGAGCNPPAGVPQLGCAVGFGWLDDGSCAPVLPDAPCPPGQRATLGQTFCHDLAPCGGTYGGAPVEPITQYVDIAAPGPHDGTTVHPWNQVSDAVANALPGAVIAIAAGSYGAVVVNKPVRLWGRCPSKVSIDALSLGDGAPGAEAHDLAVGSAAAGFGASVSGAQGVVLDRVWIHGGGALGLALDTALGIPQVTVSRSLIEGASTANVTQRGGTLTMSDTTVRGGAGPKGEGIGALFDATSKTRASLTLDHVVIEAAGGYGLRVDGADLVVDASVIRGTQPAASATIDAQRGWGLAIEPDSAAGQASTATVRRSVISGSHELGVMVRASKASFERVTIRDTLERADKTRGWGLLVQAHATSKQPAAVDVTASLVAGNRGFGVLVGGAAFTATGLAVRDTFASADGAYGDGVTALAVLAPTSVALTSARVERSQRAGVSAFGAALTVGASRIACDAFDLDRETLGTAGQIHDGGGNVCGCQTTGPCQTVSSNLAPPAAVGE